MKKLTKITVALAAVLLWATQAMADVWQVNVDGVRYEIDSNADEATIIGLASANSEATELVFAKSYVDGGDTYTYHITKVNSLAFYGKSLKKVDMSQLKYVTTMSQQCFHNCKDLTEVVLPPNLKTLSGSAFRDCSSLKEVSLPSTLTYIGASAFKGTALTALTIPSSVTYVGTELFGFWDNIQRIEMENPVPPTGFDDNAFSERLRREPMPLYVPEGSVADYKASEWWYSRFGDNIKSDDLGEVFDYGYFTYEVCEYAGKRYVDIVGGSSTYSYFDPTLDGVLHDGRVYPVSAIRDNALQDYRWDEIDLSGNMFSQLESVGYEACMGNANLKRVVLSSNINTIYDDAFAGCPNLERVDLPLHLVDLGDRAFKDCAKLQSASTGFSLKYVGNEAFCGCTSLKGFYPPANMESIGERAFYGTAMDYYILTPYVSTVGDQALANTPNLKYVFDMHTSPSNAMVAMDMFLDEGETGKRDATVIVPTGQRKYFEESHWANVFDNIIDHTNGLTLDNDTLIYRLDTNVQLIVSGDVIDVDQIGHSTIVGLSPKCKNFDVEIHGVNESWAKGVQEIGPLTLYLTKIGSRAFKDNKQLKSIDLTDLTWLDIEYQAFAGCTNLRSIGDGAIVPFIRDEAFMGSGIEEFHYNQITQSIGPRAFYNCPKLKRVVYDSDSWGGVSIGNSAFEDCKALEWLEIGAAVYQIGYSAFAGCTALKRVTSGISSPFAIDESVFDGIDKHTVPLYVPAGTAASYKVTAGWKDFFGDNISEGNLMREFDDGVFNYRIYAKSAGTDDGDAAVIEGLSADFAGTKAVLPKPAITIDGKDYPVDHIASSAFEDLETVSEMDFTAATDNIFVDVNAFFNATSLKHVRFNEKAGWYMDMEAFGNSGLEDITITSDVAAYAFIGCEKLRQVKFAGECRSIGLYAFSGCSSLQELTLPKGNEMTIGYNAFERSGLKSMTIPSYSSFYIDKYAFLDAPLTLVTSYIESPSDLDSDAFTGIPDEATLRVPYDCYWNYASMMGWDHFYNDGTIEEMPFVPTGVQPAELKAQPAAGAVYDLQGRRLDKAPRRGIYIQDGRKVVVK